MLPLPQDLTKDVFRIDAIPSQSLDTVREWLSSMDVKFYENKVNLNWKQVLKSIVEVRGADSYLLGISGCLGNSTKTVRFLLLTFCVQIWPSCRTLRTV